MMKFLSNVDGLKTLWLVMVIQFWLPNVYKPRVRSNGQNVR